MLKIFGNALPLGLGVCGVLLLLSQNTGAAEDLKTDSLVSNFTSVADLFEPIVTANAPEKVASEKKETTVARSTKQLQPRRPSDRKTNPMGQVTSVSELSDVQPTDWAFQALQSLVERYGCLEGYPESSSAPLRERTYRGNRAITRYEFAAGLNACLEQIYRLIRSTNTNNIQANGIRQEDLEALRRLQADFATELASLPKRINNLETNLTQIEAQNFSTTTVLGGEILFAASGVGGEDVNGNDIDANIVLSHRVELNFNTSFFGTDVLRARLAAGNTPNFTDVTGTNFAKLSFAGNNDNDIGLGALFYRFSASKNATITLAATGIGFGDIAPTLNPYINNSLLGNVGSFSGESPIYALNGGSGIGLEYRFSRAVRLSLGYLAKGINDPDFGLFNGPYGAMAQLTILPTRNLSLGLTYVRSYDLSTGKGSRFAEDPFEGAAYSTNSYGLQASYQVSSKFSVSGWVGLINAHAESNPNKGSDATILTWAATFAFPDLGRLGNLGGFIIGQPPKAISNDVIGREDPDTSLHLEVFYRYQISDRLAITPGVFIITNPEHNADNSLIYVGTLRTSFVF